MKIDTSARLELYSKIKKDFVEEPFLNIVQNFDAKRDYSKFKKSNYSLFIETGRYFVSQCFLKKAVSANFLKPKR